MRHPSFGRYTESRRSTGRCTSYPRTLSAAQRCRSYYQRSSPEAARQHPSNLRDSQRGYSGCEQLRIGTHQRCQWSRNPHPRSDRPRPRKNTSLATTAQLRVPAWGEEANGVAERGAGAAARVEARAAGARAAARAAAARAVVKEVVVMAEVTAEAVRAAEAMAVVRVVVAAAVTENTQDRCCSFAGTHPAWMHSSSIPGTRSAAYFRHHRKRCPPIVSCSQRRSGSSTLLRPGSARRSSTDLRPGCRPACSLRMDPDRRRHPRARTTCWCPRRTRHPSRNHSHCWQPA